VKLRLLTNRRAGELVLLSCVLGIGWIRTDAAAAATLRVGIAHADITPRISEKQPVWLAGYVPGRAATGVHDPLFARCLAMDDGQEKLAFVAVDLVGLQYPVVEQIRAQLTDFAYVAIASTHNHEGPDVIGIWGPTVLKRGVDDAYIQWVIQRVVQLVRDTEKTTRPARALFGTAANRKLLADARLPVVKDGVLRALRFTDLQQQRNLGVLVQWNCHPEALGPNNTQITADFPAYTIRTLRQQLHCPVVYVSGAVGGLMAPPRNVVRDDQDKPLPRGTFEYARGYGEAVAELARQAIQRARPIQLTPIQIATRSVGVPVTNRLYRLGRLLGILKRDGYLWNGRGKPLGAKVTRSTRYQASALRTEVACVALGGLRIAMIPGELYPELVDGHVVDPPATGVDYPRAPIEPAVAKLMGGTQWMLFGLANDEIGYIIPKRQWDRRAPYAYGRATAQYGEINSCGPDAAPIVMQALADCVAELPAARRTQPTQQASSK